MSLAKCYWMLQNARFTAFTISPFWVIKGESTGRKGGGGAVKLNGTKNDKAAIEMFMMQLIFTLDKSSFLLSRYFWICGFTKSCSYYDICKPKLSAAPLKLKIPHIMLFVFLARHFTFVQLKKGKEETRKFVNEASGRCILWDFR